MYSGVVIFIFSLLVTDSLAAITPRILGGERATENQFPFIVSIQMKSRSIIPTTYYYHCGAAIISERFILTSADCVYNDDPTFYRVSVGAHKAQGDIYMVKDVIVHPNFAKYNETYEPRNDIALLLLEKPIQFTVNTSAINIGRDFIGENHSVLVAGWGDTEVREFILFNDFGIRFELLQKYNLSLSLS